MSPTCRWWALDGDRWLIKRDNEERLTHSFAPCPRTLKARGFADPRTFPEYRDPTPRRRADNVSARIGLTIAAILIFGSRTRFSKHLVQSYSPFQLA